MMALEKEHIVLLALILFIDVITIGEIHDMIYSILLGNMKSRRHRQRNASEIAHQYSFIERMRQRYIREHITKYVDAYDRWMIFKKVYIGWTFLSPIPMFLLFQRLPEYSKLAFQIRMAISIAVDLIIFCVFGSSNSPWRTRYEK